jgi:hypothetical protein
MRFATILLLVAAVTCGSGTAFADDPPSRGTGLVVGGPVLMGVGVTAIAASVGIFAGDRWCEYESSSFTGACGWGWLTGGLGALSLVSGSVLLAVGVYEHRRYSEWVRRHPIAAGLELRDRGIGWRLEF